MVRMKHFLIFSFIGLTAPLCANCDSSDTIIKMFNYLSLNDSNFRMCSVHNNDNRIIVLLSIEYIEESNETRESLLRIFKDKDLAVPLDTSSITLCLRPPNVILRTNTPKWINLISITFMNDNVTMELDYREVSNGYTSFTRVRYELLCTGEITTLVLSKGKEKGLTGLIHP